MPVLPAGDAVRREPRAAREALPRLRHARPASSAARRSTTAPLIAELLALRAGRSARCSATPTTPSCRWCRRWPTRRSRCWTSCATWPRARGPRRARPGRAARVRARRARPARPAGLGPRLRQRAAEGARYAFSEQEVKQYFTEPKVLDGLFRIIETLFEVRDPARHARRSGTRACASIRIERAAARCRPAAASSTSTRTPAPASAAAPGWTTRATAGCAPTGAAADAGGLPGLQLRRAGVDGQPALLTHDDVTTLFHEFGHGLHHMLTQVDDLGVSGISGVEWDAVELPSQFMENFCWEWDVLRAPDRARRHRRAAAARAVRPDARRARTSRAACRRCARSSSRCSTCGCTPSRRAADARPGSCSTRCAHEVARDAAAAVQPLPATASRTSSPAATRPATTATSGPRCCRPTPGARSRKRRRRGGVLDVETGRRYRAERARGRRQPQRDGELQGLPRPRAAHRRAAAPPGPGLTRATARPRERALERGGCRPRAVRFDAPACPEIR